MKSRARCACHIKLTHYQEEPSIHLKKVCTNESFRLQTGVSTQLAAPAASGSNVLRRASHGPTWLKDEGIARELADSLHYRDGNVYRLAAFAIMPNHTHVVFKPLPSQPETNGENQPYHSLASIMQSLQGFTAYRSNRLLGREGEFWAHESFDHFVRDHDEWMRIIAYVLNNPVKAGYVSHWQEWKWSYRRNAN